MHTTIRGARREKLFGYGRCVPFCPLPLSPGKRQRSVELLRGEVVKPQPASRRHQERRAVASVRLKRSAMSRQ